MAASSDQVYNQIVTDKLNQAANALYKTGHLTRNDTAQAQQVIQDLEQFLASESPDFEGCKLVLYGSTVTGFGSRDSSDLDISLHTAAGQTHLEAKKLLIKKVCKVLESKKGIIDLHAIPEARVPLCKFTYILKPGKFFECDLTIDNLHALKTTHRLAAYSQLDVRAVKLALMVKKLARSTGFDQLNSYGWCLLVVYFLQQCQPFPVLPILLDSDDELPAKEVRKEWRKKVGQKRNRKTVGELFVDLLDYYGNQFDFERCIVSVSQKSPLKKADMDSFLGTWKVKDVSIQDPIDRTHNLGFRYKAFHGNDPYKTFPDWFKSVLSGPLFEF